MSSSGNDPVERLTRFGRALRDEGLSVGSGQILDFCRAAATLGPGDLYWSGRATLVGRREDIAVYDRVFRAFFHSEKPSFARAPRPQVPPMLRSAQSGALVDPADQRGDDRELALASSMELLRRKSFAVCTDEELQALFAARGRFLVPTRRSRRYRAAAVGVPDFRRTLRSSFRTGGEPLYRAWRARQPRPRRVILLLDVSGSMGTYSRALLFFAHIGVRTHRNWEAFCFATRLTHVTRKLAHGTPDEALGAAALDVLDWDGGTRIGECLKRFLDEHGHSGLARGAVVVICSDGLEVDDPKILGQQMERLARLAHRVVWLNPLKEDPEYAPLVRGMRTALPFIDVFSSGHNLASLEVAAEELSRAANRRNGHAASGATDAIWARHDS